jgi:hypothetical protein
MDHKFIIYIVRNLPYHDQGHRDNLFGIKGWQGAKNFGGAVVVSE